MEELEKEINKVIIQVIDEIAEKYLKILIEYIEKYVYEPNEPKEYKRTNEFLYSFEKLPQAKKRMKEIVQEIFYNSKNVKYKMQSSGIWQHGVENENYTKEMAEILNSKSLNEKYSQIEGALNIGKNGLYWNEFLKYIENNIVVDIKKGFNQKGVMLK